MGTWLVCIYVAVAYTIMRSGMEETRRSPPQTASVALLAAAIWPFLFAWVVVDCLVKGFNDTFREKP